MEIFNSNRCTAALTSFLSLFFTGAGAGEISPLAEGSEGNLLSTCFEVPAHREGAICCAHCGTLLLTLMAVQITWHHGQEFSFVHPSCNASSF
jgi:hypothetical protein